MILSAHGGYVRIPRVPHITMFAASLITLRETLEASLVVGIMLAFLTFTQNVRQKKYVWLGVGAGIALSLLLATVFHTVAGGFEGTTEALYEGIMMLVAAGLLTWMIFWMINQGRHMKTQIESEVSDHVQNNHALGIFMLSFVSTAREGVETVIFLQAALINASSGAHLTGAVLGIAVALTLAYTMFKGFAVVPLRTFFKVTSILLLLFSAGLVAHGVHEFEEAGVLSGIITPLWDLNPAVLTEGVYPALHENGVVGSLLKGLFGYNGNPSLLEVLAYGTYITAISAAWWGMTRRREVG